MFSISLNAAHMNRNCPSQGWIHAPIHATVNHDIACRLTFHLNAELYSETKDSWIINRINNKEELLPLFTLDLLRLKYIMQSFRLNKHVLSYTFSDHHLPWKSNIKYFLSMQYDILSQRGLFDSCNFVFSQQ